MDYKPYISHVLLKRDRTESIPLRICFEIKRAVGSSFNLSRGIVLENERGQ